MVWLYLIDKRELGKQIPFICVYEVALVHPEQIEAPLIEESDPWKRLREVAGLRPLQAQTMYVVGELDAHEIKEVEKLLTCHLVALRMLDATFHLEEIVCQSMVLLFKEAIQPYLDARHGSYMDHLVPVHRECGTEAYHKVHSFSSKILLHQAKKGPHFGLIVV